MVDLNLPDWEDFYRARVKGRNGQQLVKGYLAHIAIASDLNIAPIFEFSHLSALLGIDEATLAKICRAPHNYYRTFLIPKRSGGHREISVPRPILMTLQRWILRNIIARIDVHDAAHGFLKDRSIVTNARMHVGANEILKVDILNFFASIRSAKVRRLFEEIGYSDQVSAELTRICTKNDGLPQGAPTSPGISNLVVRQIDKQIADLCKSEGLTYTRYADDMTVSGERIPTHLRGKVVGILENAGLKIHPVKTRVLGPKDRKVIAGISITSGKLMPPKRFVRTVRNDVYHVVSKGVLEHMAAIGEYDPLYLERLLGRIEFWKHVTSNSEQSLRAEKSLKMYMVSVDLAGDFESRNESSAND